MILSENIKSLNKQLKELFGIDTISSLPIFKIVWSEDQFEKRLMDVTDEGISLLTPEVRTVPKYRQWISEKYVLERLVLIPEQNQAELAGIKQGYEPIFVFMDKDGEYLPPKIEVCKVVIDTLYAALGKSSLHKYKQPDPGETAEQHRKKIDKLTEDIFGDETDISDSLTRGSGIIVPKNYGVN